MASRADLLSGIRKQRRRPPKFDAQARRKQAARDCPAYTPAAAWGTSGDGSHGDGASGSRIGKHNGGGGGGGCIGDCNRNGSGKDGGDGDHVAAASVVLWGYDFYGRLGLGHHTGPKDAQRPDNCPQCDAAARAAPSPPAAVPALAGVALTAVACGAAHNVALTADGRGVLTWGKCHEGQSGHGDRWGPTGDCCVDSPRLVAANAVAAVSAQPSGSRACSERTAAQQQQQQQQPPQQRLPRPFQFGRRRVVLVAAGVSHVLAATAGAGAWAWGDNGFGQLGLGDARRRSRPAAIPALAAARVVAVAGGRHHSLFLVVAVASATAASAQSGGNGPPAAAEDKKLIGSWDAGQGRDGSGDSVGRGAGSGSGGGEDQDRCALGSEGSHNAPAWGGHILLACGSNKLGQLGVGVSGVGVSGVAGGGTAGGGRHLEPSPVAGLPPGRVTCVACGYYHSMAAVAVEPLGVGGAARGGHRADGTDPRQPGRARVMAWGSNDFGQCGVRPCAGPGAGAGSGRGRGGGGGSNSGGHEATMVDVGAAAAAETATTVLRAPTEVELDPPTAVVAALACGEAFSAVLTTRGAVLTCGAPREALGRADGAAWQLLPAALPLLCRRRGGGGGDATTSADTGGSAVRLTHIAAGQRHLLVGGTAPVTDDGGAQAAGVGGAASAAQADGQGRAGGRRRMVVLACGSNSGGQLGRSRAAAGFPVGLLAEVPVAGPWGAAQSAAAAPVLVGLLAGTNHSGVALRW